MEEIFKYVPTQHTIYTLIVLLGVATVCINAIPKIWNWFILARDKTNDYENMSKTVKKTICDIDALNEKVEVDHSKLDHICKIVETQQRYTEESLLERELILKSLLEVIHGLQEIGANGPTKKAEFEIQAYLLEKSHGTPNKN